MVAPNTISLRLGLNRTSSSSWFCDHYYNRFVYQDVHLRSYLASIRGPTRQTFGFRLGRCVILHFPKLTSSQIFLPRRPKRMQQRKPRSLTPWWTRFGKAGEISVLDESKEKKASRHQSPSHLLSQLVLADEASSGASSSEVFKLFSSRKSNLARSGLGNKAVMPLHYLVMNYYMSLKNQIRVDPVVALSHFVSPGSANSIDMDKTRMSRNLSFFVESLSSNKNGGLKDLIRSGNDFTLSGRTTSSVPMFPFFGASCLNLQDVGTKKDDPREELFNQLRLKCWNVLGKDNLPALMKQLETKDGIEEMRRVVDIMVEIILRKRGISYKANSYVSSVKRMESLLSNMTKTKNSLESVKIRNVYQSASLLAQDICFQVQKRRRSYHSLFAQIVRDLPEGVLGIRICFSGRLQSSAEKAQRKCYMHGQTSRNVFNHKLDYAATVAQTRYGSIGVKVWICYSKKKLSDRGF